MCQTRPSATEPTCGRWRQTCHGPHFEYFYGPWGYIIEQTRRTWRVSPASVFVRLKRHGTARAPRPARGAAWGAAGLVSKPVLAYRMALRPAKRLRQDFQRHPAARYCGTPSNLSILCGYSGAGVRRIQRRARTSPFQAPRYWQLAPTH